MTLPAGVKVDGYVAWDTSGTFDPLESVQTVPVRFTPAFTDDPLTPAVTLVRAIHVTELRARIDAVLELYGLPAFTYTNAAIAAGATVQAVDIAELRTALDAAYTAAGRGAPVYTDPALVTQSTTIKAVHVAELRSAVTDLESAP
jgi:hypothetical protein